MTTHHAPDPFTASGDAETRQGRQVARQSAISAAVMEEGTLRIDALAERFGISLMTAHRDLDALERRGLLRKGRGVATATSTSLVESSDVYRAARQVEEKDALAAAALEMVEPGQAILLDDSTTVLHLARRLTERAPLTVITNVLTILDELRGAPGLTLIGLGGQYVNWCNAFMGSQTTKAISDLHADVVLMSTAAIIEDVAYHQSLETTDVKRAMLGAADRRILLADHTKFDKRALHALAPLTDFDAVLVDAATPRAHVARLRSAGVEVVVAPRRPVERRATES